MKLLTKGIENDLKKHPFGSTDGKLEEAKVIVRFFGGSAATWLVAEGEETEDGWMFFGAVTIWGDEWEYGYFSLKELEGLRFPPFGLGVERDLYFKGNVKEGMAY